MIPYFGQYLTKPIKALVAASVFHGPILTVMFIPLTYTMQKHVGKDVAITQAAC